MRARPTSHTPWHAALELRPNASRAVERRRSKGSRTVAAALGGVANAARESPANGLRGLVTLTAPAGYGKTTLAAQWAERERRPVAWLSVDEVEDDAAHLLAQLNAALDRLEGQADKRTVRRRKEWTAELARLASRLSSSEDLVLVVDNAHFLRSRNATKALSTLAEHVPAG